MIVNPIVWGNGGDTPQEKEVLTTMIIYNTSTNLVNDVITGGENYEPQS